MINYKESKKGKWRWYAADSRGNAAQSITSYETREDAEKAFTRAQKIITREVSNMMERVKDMLVIAAGVGVGIGVALVFQSML